MGGQHLFAITNPQGAAFFQRVQLLSLLLLLCCLSPTPNLIMALDCFPPDLQALRAFAPHFASASSNSSQYYKALEETWGPGNDCCSWDGISCSAATSGQPPRVSGLSLFIFLFSNVSSATNFLQPLCNLSLLSSLYLDSSVYLDDYTTIYTHIPACLGHLLALRNLSLLNLKLQGPLPSSFSLLLHLQYLNFGSNKQLSGTLLPISNLPNLTYVNLAACALSGPLPPFHAPLLQYLDLSENSLENSTLLDFSLLSNLPSLTTLDLSNTQISGSIPPSFSRLSNLVNLSLSDNNLSGEIPQSFCKLARLMRLDLGSNAFNTSLDSLECKFMSLTYLDLAGNRFTGPFPRWIGRSPSLQVLYLSSNDFRGPLPDEWRNLQKVHSLDLSGNPVLPSQYGARLPDWLFHFPLESFGLASCGLQTQDLSCRSKLSLFNQSLHILDLSDNHLTGRDTLECFALYNFSQAIDLDLSGNPLSIVLSKVLLPPLVSTLDISSCNLHGHVPEAGYSFINFAATLSFANNSLFGSLPTQLFNSSAYINSVDFSHNHFTGIDPQLAVSGLLSFESMDLSHNALAMDLPSLLANIGLINCDRDGFSILFIDLSHNALVGEIPAFLGLCNKKLRRIKIDNNGLVGHIPDELGGLEYLETLTLNNNHLKGTIPAFIIGSSSLILLDLSYNELEGNLSTLFSFSGTTYLRVVLLSHNRISGSIPLSFGIFMPNLQLIDFSNNRLTGIIPEKLHLLYFQNLEANKSGRELPFSATGKLYDEVLLVVKGLEQPYPYVLEAMTALDLSGNYLEGSIPEEMGNLAGLLFLNLSHNNLSGSIPSTLAKLSRLQSLDLSFNQLEGPLPSQLSNLTKLSVFNVSFNAGLSGSIPQGPQFEMTESYKGDRHLCGSPTLRDCKPSTRVVPHTTEQPAGSITARWIDEWIALPGLSLGIVVGFGTTLFLLHYKH